MGGGLPFVIYFWHTLSDPAMGSVLSVLNGLILRLLLHREQVSLSAQIGFKFTTKKLHFERY